MKSLVWDRGTVIAGVRDVIWSYVSPSSQFEQSGLLVAAALLKWPETDARRLGEIHFVLSDEVGFLLDEMPRLMRHLSTASAREEQRTAERLHGPVQWNSTLSLRAAAGSQDLFITAPANRVYQTSENELLVHVLDAIVRSAHSSGWDQSPSRKEPAQKLRDRLSAAIKWQQSRMLSAVERMPPTSRSLSRVRSGRNRSNYAAVISAYDKLVSLVERLDRRALRAAIENVCLVTAQDATLFELATTFSLVDALLECDWRLQAFYLFQGHVRIDGVRQDGRNLQLSYQSTPPGLAIGSRYRQVLAAHRFSRQHDLRPDLVLSWTDPNGDERWLLVECKLSQSSVGHAARQALVDLLSYRRAFDTSIAETSRPYGLGVAWGAGLAAAIDSEVALCTLDTLKEAVREIVV